MSTPVLSLGFELSCGLNSNCWQFLSLISSLWI